MFIVISTSSNISSRRFRDILNHDEEMNEGEGDKEEGKDEDGEAEANPRDIVRSPSSVSTGTQVTYFKDLEN